ncbi:hypothetical protein VNO80_03587 [Phaseolus coccineus]|uniref:Uncharacterized protein n=1 Tax=Phaseolus coccineus TaxID=3886 RepID=A0AAN9NRR5_PHACN
MESERERRVKKVERKIQRRVQLFDHLSDSSFGDLTSSVSVCVDVHCFCFVNQALINSRLFSRYTKEQAVNKQYISRTLRSNSHVERSNLIVLLPVCSTHLIGVVNNLQCNTDGLLCYNYTEKLLLLCCLQSSVFLSNDFSSLHFQSKLPLHEGVS